ncbi:MAG: hypothetical protein COB61_005775 [Thiotrichales bacterium]|nr:hypothetical protein [Thiotrichales bacterium]
MRINAKLKSKKLNKKLYNDLKKIAGKINAGYPKENSESHELDTNGYSALDKAYAINYANKDFIPYLQISYENNKLKYQKRFKQIVRLNPSKQKKQLDNLGAEMVEDIKETLSSIQFSPTSNNAGCIYGAVSFVRVKI